ncbi:hypothetical protein F7731_16430 [Cytobacillus depressus]|uniref:Uncharacterized protein n=1 Tax=Cytobacillus depressus TaxID=1602942 RepID=A0A6L3V8A2_9BACI|nr:hypothetical protein [Cytobacillus depressus]KAB2333124.1 hypothetical protein F7731_16430 [Cytobacillus depressus]
MMWFLIILCVSLLGIGVLIDWWNKKNGKGFDQEENQKHVSESERAYVESYMHNAKNDHSDGPF